MTENVIAETTPELPEGYESAEELYRTTIAEIGLLFAGFDMGMSSKKKTFKKIRKALKPARDYSHAVAEAEVAEEEQERKVKLNGGYPIVVPSE